MTTADLHAVESALETSFPQAYISFVTSHGPLFTPGILPKLVAAREAGRPAPEGFDVSEFFAPAEILETHRLYVSGGMDNSIIPFAMDNSGNVFGFRKAIRLERPDDLGVLFFDHDFCEVRSAADSFDAWLQGFLVLDE